MRIVDADEAVDGDEGHAEDGDEDVAIVEEGEDAADLVAVNHVAVMEPVEDGKMKLIKLASE